MRNDILALGFAVLLVAGTAATLVQTTTESPDLDLREANVVGVEFEQGADDERRYDFSVTLYHDDDGEAGYANWWQVETLNGSELGRRDLLHAHSTQPFTRSERIKVPANASLLVVRGHDQTHGYGGQAMVVDLRTNSTQTIRQGSDARNFNECTVIQPEASEGTTTTATARTATATARTATATTTATAGTDLVECPWEANATAQTTA
jgi:hypothetical protein